MSQILLWGAASLVGLYLAAFGYSLISRAIARALLHGLRKTLSRESRALLSLEQEAAHYERLLGELNETGVAIEDASPAFLQRQPAVPA